jgi:PAS domain S-box-containing protein
MRVALAPALDLMLVGSFGVMGLITVLFYFFARRRDPAPLWLGLFCLGIAAHFLFAPERSLAALAFPGVGVETHARLAQFGTYLTLPLLALFIQALYPVASAATAVRVLVGIGTAGAITAAFLPAKLHAVLAPAMEVVIFATAAWGFFEMARGAWRRKSTWAALIALMPLLYPVIALDLLVDTTLRMAIAPLGLVAFVIAPVAVLTLRLTRAFDAQTRYLHDLVDSVPVALSLRDPAGKYLFVNRAWRDWFSDSSQAVVGEHVSERLPKEKADEVLALDRAALERGADAPAHVSEFELRDRQYTQTRSVMTDSSGAMTGLLVATIDTSDLHAQEKQLRDEMELTRALIDENPNAMYLKDREGRYLTVNDAWTKMVGVSRERAIGRNVLEIFGDAEAQKYHAEDMRLLADGHGGSEVESLRTGPDGKPQWVIIRKAVLRDADGHVRGLIGTNTDITALKNYERELADRNKYITDVIESLPVSLAMRDSEGRHVQVNRTWERYYKLKREDVIGKRFDELPGWKGNPELEEFSRGADRLDREALARGPHRPLEPREHRWDGRIFLNTRRAFIDTEGRTIGVVAVSMDVTDQKILAEILEMEQRRLALVVSASKAGIVDWDGRTHATYYSPRFRELLGHAPDADTTNWPDYFKELMHPDDREPYTSAWQAFIKNKQAGGDYLGPHEHRLRRKDGTYVWVQVSGVAVRDAKGFVTRWIATTTDITERREQEERLKQHERVLAEQKRILETTLENIDQGITMVDRDLRAIALNRRFLELLDLPAEMFAPGEFTLEHAFRYNAQRGEYGPGDVDEQVQMRMALARKFEPHYFERQRPNGRTLAIRGRPLPDGAGFVTTYSDVTEQKRAEAELRQSVALREEVERMSRHDLKTPINSVIAVSRLLRENKRLTPEDGQLLATVERAAYRILNMVNLSLDLFRMEQGTYEFRPQAVDLDEVASKVATDLQGQAASKNVTVRVTRAGRVVAHAEELLCYSIFANLVKNAIEAAPAGTTVTVELANQGDRVAARVHNRGAVPADLRARFFEKYATAGKAAGLGLGTYSAHLLARVQGGDLSLETSEAEGTMLTLDLKAATAEQVRVKVEGGASSEQATPMPDLPPLRILIADDDEFNRLVLRRYLPSPPFKVTLAVNGRAAVTAAELEWPDVVLLDLEMPVMDGYEAAKRLREIERARRRKRILIIAISSNDEEVIVKRALAGGCDHYLVKPAPREILWQLLAGASVPLASGGVPSGEAREDDPVWLDADLEAAVPAFLSSRREALAEMPEALESGDREAFRRLAHRLAGSFALYGFKWASVQSRELERDAGTGDADDLAARAERLGRHLEAVKIQVVPKDTVT